MTRLPARRIPSALRRFIDSEASGGLVLIAMAGLALALANSPVSAIYAEVVTAKAAGLSLQSWVNDGLMAVFFLLVGLEIKREMLHGQLRTKSARAIPGLAALGGMAVPALVFAAINWGQPGLRGWAIPSATDIAFALAVLSLLGDRVPASLKVFLTALAILDDLGAVLIIALVYTQSLSPLFLGLSGAVFLALVALNRAGVRRLWPFLIGGVLLLALIWRSGVHSTVAGVLLAFTIPADGAGAEEQHRSTPLHRLEVALDPWVAFLILPLFAFLNTGVAVGGAGFSALAEPVTLGVAAGLVLGKQGGVLAGLGLGMAFGTGRPRGASWLQLYGTALLCGIGFTMSLFIGMLAYGPSPDLQSQSKIGVLVGSLLSAAAGTLVLRFAARPGAGRQARAVGEYAAE